MEAGKDCTVGQLHRPREGEPHGKHPYASGSTASYCFGNSDSKKNGELAFLNAITPVIKSIYDVGADTSDYLQFSGEVHYFEPIESSNIFKQPSTNNSKSYFNAFGLSNVTDDKLRITWEAGDVLPNPMGEDTLMGDNIYMKTKRGDEYMIENGFDSVDFISIDTEGSEYQVLLGFGDFLHNVKAIQFEYGGATWSAGNKLVDIINHLQKFNFCGFSYLHRHGLVPIPSPEGRFVDHYDFCNIVCVNTKYAREFDSLELFPFAHYKEKLGLCRGCGEVKYPAGGNPLGTY